MIRLVIVSIILAIVLFYLWKKNTNDQKKADLYKYLLIILVVLVLGFFLATTGKFILPKLFQIITKLLPFITRFIA
tara:strand:+ start:124 stop:351 length:228 start_codon:yes stop_codon:yes gene_type:complete